MYTGFISAPTSGDTVIRPYIPECPRTAREHRVQEAVRLFHDGGTLEEIARAVGKSIQTVKIYLKEGGISLPRAEDPRGRERNKRIISLLLEGYRQSEIAVRFQLSREYIRQIVLAAEMRGEISRQEIDSVPRRPKISSLAADPRNARISELHAQGLTFLQIVRAIGGITYSQVSVRAQFLGLKPNIKRRFADEDVRAAWEKARSVTGTARIMRCRPTTINRYLWRMGLLQPRKRARPATTEEIRNALVKTGSLEGAAEVLGYKMESLRNRCHAEGIRF